MFEQQLAISTYWDTVGGANFLPGTSRAADRFARMSWMLNAVPAEKDEATAMAEVMSLMRSISVPLGIQDPKLPNIASTRWRTAADINAKRYFFDNVHTPSVFWVDLDKLDLKAGSSALKLDLQGTPYAQRRSLEGLQAGGALQVPGAQVVSAVRHAGRHWPLPGTSPKRLHHLDQGCGQRIIHLELAEPSRHAIKQRHHLWRMRR